MSNRTEAVFIADFEREVRVSANRQTITHRAMAWSGTYTPDQLLRWILFYERLAQGPGTPLAKADVEALCAARDLLRQEGILS